MSDLGSGHSRHREATLHFSTTTDHSTVAAQRLTLYFGTIAFKFSDATYSSSQHSYRWTDTALNPDNGEQVAVRLVSTDTVPSKPTGVTASVRGPTRIDLEWTAPETDGGSPITKYQVDGKPNRANSDWVPLVDSPITTTSFSHTNSQTLNPLQGLRMALPGPGGQLRRTGRVVGYDPRADRRRGPAPPSRRA